jgi:O-antigen/teichoic acid export membrane protein
METAFFRFSSIETDKKRRETIFSTAFLSIALTTSVFLIAATFSAQTIAEFIDYHNHTEYIVWFVWIIAFDVLATIPFARLRQLNKPFAFVFINLAHILLNIGLNLFFILYCPWVLNNPDAITYDLINAWYDPSVGIGYIFIANLASSALKFILLLPWLSGLRNGWNQKVFKMILPYALPLLLLGLAGIINETFDRAFFALLSGLPELEAHEQLGIYGACYKIAMLLSIGIQAYRFAAEPFIFNSKGSSAQNAEMQASIMKYYFIVAIFITLILLCFIDLAILMVGPEFREGIGVIPILLAAYICFGAIFNLSFWYKLNNKTMYGALIAILGAVVTVVANVILVPVLGYHGAAWATLAAYVTMLLLSYFLGQKHHPIPYNIKEIALYSTLGLFLWLAVITLDFHGFYKYLIAGIAILIYIIVVFFREKSLRLKPNI